MADNPLAPYRATKWDKSVPWSPVLPRVKHDPASFTATFPLDTPDGPVMVEVKGPIRTWADFELVSEAWCRRWNIPPMQEKPVEPYRGKR